jgi:hypothetical protein
MLLYIKEKEICTNSVKQKIILHYQLIATYIL